MSNRKTSKYTAPILYCQQTANDFKETLRQATLESYSRPLNLEQLISDNSKDTSSEGLTFLDCHFSAGRRFFEAIEQTFQFNASKPFAQALHYIAIDNNPLSHDQYRSLFELKTDLGFPQQVIQEQFLAQYPALPFSGVHRFHFNTHNSTHCRVSLSLYFSPLLEALSEIANLSIANNEYCLGEKARSIDLATIEYRALQNEDGAIDNAYLQSFLNITCTNNLKYIYYTDSQESKPLKAALSKAGITNEYCTNNSDMHCLQLTDCIPTRTQNHAKNELLEQSPTPPYFLKAINSNANAHTNKSFQKSVAVIGAGIAGAQIANGLARKGFEVDVFEASTIASGASGNAQGVVYTRPGILNDPLNEFNFIAQQFADNFYAKNGYYENCGSQCGVLHLAMNEKKLRTLQALYARLATEKNHFQWVSSTESEAACGINTPFSGLLYLQSGWLNPSELCSRLLAHENIRVHTKSPVAKIQFNNEKWKLLKNDAQMYGEYSICIIANAHDAIQFEQSDHLPIKKIRGQVTHTECSEDSRKLKRVVCGDSYIAPPSHLSTEHSSLNGALQSIGASFNLGDFNPELEDKDQLENIRNANSMFATDLFSAEHIPTTNAGRVGFRCTTLDYFPIAGAAPKAAEMRGRFAYLSKKANSSIHDCGDYHPGLYTFIGFGSRGLAYTPICAEILSSLIAGMPVPMRMPLYQYLHPARFLIRDLIRRNR